MILFVKIKKIFKQQNNMESTKKIATFLFLAFMFYACDLNRSPKCNDRQVRELVLKIMSEHLKDEFLKTASRDFSFFGLMQSKIYVKVFNKKAYNEAPNYGDLNKYRGQEEYLDRILNALDSLFHPTKLNLKNIVTAKVERELRKCECEAQLIYNDTIKNSEPVNINYTAQYTDDGNLYVRVFLDK